MSIQNVLKSFENRGPLTWFHRSTFMQFVIIGVLATLLILTLFTPLFLAVRSPRFRVYLDLVAVGVALTASLFAGTLLLLVPFY